MPDDKRLPDTSRRQDGPIRHQPFEAAIYLSSDPEHQILRAAVKYYLTLIKGNPAFNLSEQDALYRVHTRLIWSDRIEIHFHQALKDHAKGEPPAGAHQTHGTEAADL